MRTRSGLFADDAATLLLPKMPLAAYDFGAYGNDFLPPLLGKPTVSVGYLPQPNVRLDGLLKVLTSAGGGLEAAPLLRAMGIGTVLVHDDVTYARGFDARGFGNSVATFGRIAILKPPLRPLPRYAQSSGTVPVIGDTGIALYGGMHNVAAVGAAPSDYANFCRGRTALVLAQFTSRKNRESGAIDIPCARPVAATALVTAPPLASIAIAGATRAAKLRQSAQGPYRAFSAMLALRAGRTWFAFSFKNRRDRALYVLLAPPGVPRTPAIAPAPTQPYGKIGTLYLPTPSARIVIFNENFDPSWQGFLKLNGRWVLENNFAVNYFANAWRVPANTPLLIVNTLTILTIACAFLGAIFALIYITIVLRSLRPRAT